MNEARQLEIEGEYKLRGGTRAVYFGELDRGETRCGVFLSCEGNFRRVHYIPIKSFTIEDREIEHGDHESEVISIKNVHLIIKEIEARGLVA